MTATGQESLSIFFPAYNDWGTIGTMVAVAHRTARRLTSDFEIIVVNDASPDHVEEVLEERERPRLDGKDDPIPGKLTPVDVGPERTELESLNGARFPCGHHV